MKAELQHVQCVQRHDHQITEWLGMELKSSPSTTLCRRLAATHQIRLLMAHLTWP